MVLAKQINHLTLFGNCKSLSGFMFCGGNLKNRVVTLLKGLLTSILYKIINCLNKSKL